LLSLLKVQGAGTKPDKDPPRADLMQAAVSGAFEVKKSRIEASWDVGAFGTRITQPVTTSVRDLCVIVMARKYSR